MTALAVGALRPIVDPQWQQIAERMLDPNGPAFQEQLERIRERRRGSAAGRRGRPRAPGTPGLASRGPLAGGAPPTTTVPGQTFATALGGAQAAGTSPAERPR